MKDRNEGAFVWAALLIAGAASCSSEPAPVHATASSADARIVDLRCEYLRDPLGLDVLKPRLSWRLEPADTESRGLRQTAYRIRVSRDRARLESGQADLWDSGVVESDSTTFIEYAGRPLVSNQACFWSVRARDQKGSWTPWSSPARWTMGLLAADDWKGKWIGTGAVSRKEKREGLPTGNYMPDPWFRKTFELNGVPERATAHVASVGYHELYVNGKRAGDVVLAPCATDHTKRARYVTYDITPHLRPGKNALGIWLGASWSIYPSYKTPDKPLSPIVIAQAEIELPGDKRMRLITDGSWKTHPSPNTTIGQWNFMNFGGELYDANREIPGWCDANLDDGAWKPAKIFAPQLELSAERVEPNRIVKEIAAVAVEERPNGVWRVDMGVNFVGWMEIDVSGKPGTRVDFLYSEVPDKEMTHRIQSAYVIGPSGKGTFRNRFNYHSGRWITVKGLVRKPILKHFRGYHIRTDYRVAAKFDCADRLMNDLFAMFRWTFENLSLGGYVVDCPQRERMGYGGDAHATTEPALNTYHLGAFYTKWAEDWRDVQGKEASWGVGVKAGKPGAGDRPSDGNLPYTAPTYWGGGGPGWSGFCVTLPWMVYRYTGDTRILDENFRTIERWLAFLATKSKDDMLVRWGGKWDFLGDWLWPGAKGVNGDIRETLFFNNCYWVFNLQTAAKIADVLGRPDRAASWRKRAAAVRRAVHKTFFNPDDASYVDGMQAYLAIALLTGVPPEGQRARVWKRLEEEILVKRGGHIWAGITGGAFLMKTLLEGDRVDLMVAMASKENYPGWGDMIKRGATTFWENWPDDHHSKLHSSYLHIGYLFIPGLAGIRLDEKVPGFKAFVIRPPVQTTSRLTRIQGNLETLHGTIESAWTVSEGMIRIEVKVPPNTTCRLEVPTREPGSVREGGRPAAESTGVKSLGNAIYRLEPGRYAFEAAARK
jgi:alpha-L-rhamnosidase